MIINSDFPPAESKHYFFVNRQLGFLSIEANCGQVKRISFTDHPPENKSNFVDPILLEAEKQLKEYFQRRRTIFTFPLLENFSPFARAIYKRLQATRPGETISYQQLTIQAGFRGGFRATGQVLHHNPLSIVIPCHRVIRANGQLGGFGAGLVRKIWLLEHEKKFLTKFCVYICFFIANFYN